MRCRCHTVRPTTVRPRSEEMGWQRPRYHARNHSEGVSIGRDPRTGAPRPLSTNRSMQSTCIRNRCDDSMQKPPPDDNLASMTRLKLATLAELSCRWSPVGGNAATPQPVGEHRRRGRRLLRGARRYSEPNRRNQYVAAIPVFLSIPTHPPFFPPLPSVVLRSPLPAVQANALARLCSPPPAAWEPWTLKGLARHHVAR